MKSSYLFLNELRVHYLRWGDHPASRPAILLHGLASNARIWELTAPQLAEAGLNPYAPDARAHGLSDKPEGDLGFVTYYKDLAAFIDTIEAERPLIVGHSWGAMIALEYAARRPVGPRSPSGLVLVDGGMTQLDDDPDDTWEIVRRRLTPPHLAGTSLEAFTDLLLRYYPHWVPDEHIMQIILANFEIDEGDHIYPRLSFENHMQIVRAIWEFKTYERFTRLNCPVLMVPAKPTPPLSGESEKYHARKQRGIQRARDLIPELQVHWMENSIHDIPLQRPAELARLILEFSSGL